MAHTVQAAALCWSSYFDDYLSICNQVETKHLDVCTSLLFQLLGWKLSEEKLVPYHTCCKVLGIELDLSRSPSGQASLANTNARQEELTFFLKQTLDEGCLGKHKTVTRPPPVRLKPTLRAQIQKLPSRLKHAYQPRFQNSYTRVESIL